MIRIHVQDAFDRTNSYLNEDDVVARLLLQCNNGTKIQYAIAKAIRYGWLPANKHWRICVEGYKGPLTSAVLEVIEICDAVDAVYNLKTSPPSFVIEDENGIQACYKRNGESIFEEVNAEILERYFSIEPLTIRIEDNKGPFAADAPTYFEEIDIVIRPTLLRLLSLPKIDIVVREFKVHTPMWVHLKNH